MKTDLKEILYEEYIVKKKSIETISKEINIYTVKIRWMLRYFNIPVRPRGNPSGTPRRNGTYILNENLN